MHVLITVTVTGIINNRTITADGGLYNEEDELAITAGGTGASLKLGPCYV